MLIAGACAGHCYYNDAFALQAGSHTPTQSSCLYPTNVWKGRNILPYRVTCQCTVMTPVNWLFLGRNTTAVTNVDSRFTNLIVKGLKSVYRIGFQGNAIPVRRAKKNMVPAETHPEVVASSIPGPGIES